MKKYFQSSIEPHKDKIEYLTGSIDSRSILKKIPDEKIGFVYAKNVIQFLSFEQLIHFMRNMNIKMMKGGTILLVYENPYRKELYEMIGNIHKYKKDHPKMSINDVVKKYYSETNFPFFRNCSFQAYLTAPKFFRFPGTPCQLSVGAGMDGVLLIPQAVKGIMGYFGFAEILLKEQKNKEKTVIQIFKKINDAKGISIPS